MSDDATKVREDQDSISAAEDDEVRSPATSLGGMAAHLRDWVKRVRASTDDARRHLPQL